MLTALTSSRAETPTRFFHVTVLSNLVRGYDKYRRVYDKAGIADSTFPDRFFLLRSHELHIGVAKATRLLVKLGVAGDRLIAIETHPDPRTLLPNARTGLGQYVQRSAVSVEALHFVGEDGQLTPVGLEQACGLSYRLAERNLAAFTALVPRTVSVLPVASACQARCAFCFSKASVSAEVTPEAPNWERIEAVIGEAARRGAARMVITGGGEPTLIPELELARLIRLGAARVPKVVLISNGARWGALDDDARDRVLGVMENAGLSVLALSRHHGDAGQNTELMRLDTRSDSVARTLATRRTRGGALRLRWICVLQQGGVADAAGLEQYLDWVVTTGADEVCFKELYVSASVESEYYDREANHWSHAHQVPLSVVVNFAERHGWPVITRLPWGAPVYSAVWRDRPLKIAAYTEPSVLWERTHRICRSWNLLADGRCLASLEDRASEV